MSPLPLPGRIRWMKMTPAELIAACDDQLQWLKSDERQQDQDPINQIKEIKDRLRQLVHHAVRLFESDPPVLPRDVEALDYPRSAAIATAIVLVTRLRNWAVSKTAPTQRPGVSRPSEQTSSGARAIALISDAIRHRRPVPTVTVLAQMVECSRSTLYRDSQFMAAWLALKAKPQIPRGRRTDSGDIEATSD